MSNVLWEEQAPTPRNYLERTENGYRIAYGMGQGWVDKDRVDFTSEQMAEMVMAYLERERLVVAEGQGYRSLNDYHVSLNEPWKLNGKVRTDQRPVLVIRDPRGANHGQAQ
jgi:hypothetical protein